MVESTSYTPLWVTIVGYITTVVPCIVSIILEILNRKKQKTFEESLKEIKKAQANAIDKYKFLNEKNMILKKLNNFDLQLKKDLLGFSLANDILIVIVKIQGYANTIKFYTLFTTPLQTLHWYVMLYIDEICDFVNQILA